ncbi:hypothetical protein ABZV31_10805 [Streptomyces sp. NPDC005202]|uniref:hypothetical protein n=1 Tax=Streptomyces sp. NPDC005202 TaxID=3157021 RepID=UPI0033A833C9
MSNSTAAAVLTTPDLAEALRAVHTLLGIADLDCAEVDFEAVIRSPHGRGVLVAQRPPQCPGPGSD